MKVQKDMIVGLNERAFLSYRGYKTPKHLKNFLFKCLHDAGDLEYDDVEVEVFCHKTFQLKLPNMKKPQRYKKNELKGTKYKFRTKVLV